MTFSRRTLLAAGPEILAAQGPANDRIRLGLIGAGGRARDLFQEVLRAKENAHIVAVCDVWKVNREAMSANVAKAFDAPPLQSTRYQELLARKDIDAVLIATPDVTHPRILADAVAAGKDVYVEKPFAVDFADGKMAWQAVKKSKQVVQVGTQRRSDSGLIAVAQAIQNGVIGKVTRVSMDYHFQSPRWNKDLSNVRPEDVDWEAFQFGGRITGPFNARKLREWQLFRETTNGISGLWLCHLIDLAAWFLNDPYPKQAMTMGGVYLYKDGRDTSDVYQTMIEYRDCLVTFAMSLTNAAGGRNLWFGTKGTIDAEALKISADGSLLPDRVSQPGPIPRAPGVESHMANFLRCVRSRQTPRASVDAGFSHAVAGCMAATSLETGRRVRFDPVKMELA